MILISNNETKPFSIRNQKIKGFSVNAFLTSIAVNNYCTNTDVDFTKALLKVILKRDGHNIVIVQDDLKALGLSGNLETLSKRSFYQDHPYAIDLNLKDVNTVGNSLVAFDIDLGGTIDLRSTDELYCEISLTNGLFSASVDLNSSYLEIKPIKSLDFERFVPLIKSYVIQGGERRKSFDLGDNITKITILNYDKTNYQNPVVNSLALSSKQLDDVFSFRDLINQKSSNRLDYSDNGLYLESYSEFDQCFEICSSELDSVNLDIQFNPENVTANKNLIVVHSYYTDMKTIAQADAQALKALDAKLGTLKQNAQNAQI